MFKMTKWISISVASLLFAGCGGSSSGTTTQSNVLGASNTQKVGYLIDSRVGGAHYVCADGKEDNTTADGKFVCAELPASFFIGKLKLGEIATMPTDNFVYLQDLVGVNRDVINDPKLLKMAQVLQSLDNDNNPDNNIFIDENMHNLFNTDTNMSNLNLADFNSSLHNADSNKSLVSLNDAKGHLKAAIVADGSDITAPVITLTGESHIMAAQNSTYTDAGATAVDNIDGLVNVVVSGSVNTNILGTYTLTYTANDSANNSGEATRTVEVTKAPKIIDVAVASREDDAEEVNGKVKNSSSDLELIQDSNKVQTVGLRFNGIIIPKGVTISKAYIQFQADETSSDVTNLTIHGEKVANATAFTENDNDISGRTTTNASASWSQEAWTSVGERAAAQQTSDLTAIVQELVNQGTWENGNAMAFIITGSGKRVAESFDGSRAPALHIEFLTNDAESGTGEGNGTGTETDTTPPVITLTGANPLALTVGDTYTEAGATATDDVDGTVTVTASATSVDTSVAGTQNIIYSATDAAGNEANATRTITVSEATVVDNSTVKEDAENNTTTQWLTSDDTNITVSNIVEDSGNHVIKIERSSQTPYATLGGKNPGDTYAWNDTTSNTISWRMNVPHRDFERVTVNVKILDANGDLQSRYIRYTYTDVNERKGDTGLSFGLGGSMKDTGWKTYTRNLSDDLHLLEANATLNKINGIRFDGSMSVDDIKVSTTTN